MKNIEADNKVCGNPVALYTSLTSRSGVRCMMVKNTNLPNDKKRHCKGVYDKLKYRMYLVYNISATIMLNHNTANVPFVNILTRILVESLIV